MSKEKNMAGAPSKSEKFFRNEMNAAKYEAIVSAFRDSPGNYSRAAREAGVDPRTAKRGWLRGWPELGLPPIREKIVDEQREARVMFEREKRQSEREEAERQLMKDVEQRDRARNDAVNARKAEADLVRANRGNTIALVSVTGRVLRGALRSASDLEQAFATGLDSDGKKLSVVERVNMLDRLARTVERCSRAARDTMAMERILLGEPTEIIGVSSDFLSDDDSLREIDEFARAAQRARERRDQREERKLRLVRGGQKAANGSNA